MNNYCINKYIKSIKINKIFPNRITNYIPDQKKINRMLDFFKYYKQNDWKDNFINENGMNFIEYLIMESENDLRFVYIILHKLISKYGRDILDKLLLNRLETKYPYNYMSLYYRNIITHIIFNSFNLYNIRTRHKEPIIKIQDINIIKNELKDRINLIYLILKNSNNLNINFLRNYSYPDDYVSLDGDLYEFFHNTILNRKTFEYLVKNLLKNIINIDNLSAIFIYYDIKYNYD